MDDDRARKILTLLLSLDVLFLLRRRRQHPPHQEDCHTGQLDRIEALLVASQLRGEAAEIRARRAEKESRCWAVAGVILALLGVVPFVIQIFN
jgi:hypothetical protein